MATRIAQMLRELPKGEGFASAEVPSELYVQLRRTARFLLRNQPPGHTLQATALVHEAYLKVFGSETEHVSDRAHFLAVMSRVMRQVLVDHARKHSAAKRGGARPMQLEDADLPAAGDMLPEAGLLDLHRALDRLAIEDLALARVVEMHYFGGMTAEDIASVVPRTAHAIRHDLRAAKAWLRRELAR